MARNILQDITTPERKSIRHVPLPESRRSSAAREEGETLLYEREQVEWQEGSGERWRRFLVWGVAIFFLGLLSLALVLSFSGATITVTPKTARSPVNAEFVASRSAGALYFARVPLLQSAEAVIPAPLEKRVSEKASGAIVVYNNFSVKPQRLIKNTRFETASGLIYRIDRSITVPGRKGEGGAARPGSAETTVYADSPGAEYNMALSDFTIPGFKSDPARFAAFYARSKTPMTGGFEGVVSAPAESALAEAREKLHATLEEKIRRSASASRAEGLLLFPGATAYSFESLPLEAKGKDSVIVRERATGAAFLFKREELSRAVAGRLSSAPPGLPVEIPNLEELQFALRGEPALMAKAEEIRFTLKGDARIVWLFDEEKLRQALLGKPRGDLAAALSAFPAIEKVDLVLRPFWRRRFPENPDKIAIERVPEPSGEPQLK